MALAVAEVALRWTQPGWVVPYPPFCFRPRLFQAFPPHGYRLHPSRTLADQYPVPEGRSFAVHANADGFRGRDLREPDPRPRVVVLGDSMVFGPGVEEAERCTERLEASEPGWRIDNLGMIGFGPDLMLRAYETVGRALRPTVVVVTYFSHDVYRVVPENSGVGFPLPRYLLGDGGLVSVPYPNRPWWMRLHLVQGARYGAFRYTNATFPLNAAILERLREHVAADGARLLLAYTPGPIEYADDRRRRDFLAAWARAAGVAWLDLGPALAEHGGPALFIPNDAHWNADGHVVVAGAMREALVPMMAGAPTKTAGGSEDPPAASPSRPVGR